MYIVKSYHLPFKHEFSIYNNWISKDKKNLIERIEKDLEEKVLLEKVEITELEDGFLSVNNSTEKWLQLVKLEVI